MEGRIIRQECLHRCGWARSWHDSPAYYARIIDHPLYGPISGRSLVEKDLTDHICGEYLEAIRRLNAATAKVVPAAERLPQAASAGPRKGTRSTQAHS